MKSSIKHFRFVGRCMLLATVAAAIAIGCANRGGGPQGGPKDETPPRVISSKPDNGAVNHHKPNVEIVFDEIVVLNNAFEKVVVSPPQNQAAEVKAIERKVKVAFQDSLQPNTTYTIDFSDAIVDNNEGNKLVDYSFSFSTGDVIDTLMMSGILIDAYTLNPVSNAIIGIHSDVSDTAFTTKKFDRISKSNPDGLFRVKNIKQDTYRIFALNDLSGDFLFDQSDEAIAFLDTTFVPTAENFTTNDTLWKDSVTIDTVKVNMRTTYKPDSIVLKFFKEKTQRQYFIRAERKLPYKFSLMFNAPLDTLPLIQPINFEWSDNVLTQKSLQGDTLTYWLKDSLMMRTDTLAFVLHYPKTDLQGQLVNESDTLELPVRRDRKPAVTTSKRKKDEKPPMEFIELRSNLTNSFDVYKAIQINFVEPVRLQSDTMLVLEQQVDTLWNALSIKLDSVDEFGMAYKIAHEWKEDATYRLNIDSAAFVAPLSNLHTNKFAYTFKVKTKEDYATLIIDLENFTGKEMLQLLDATEKVLREKKADESTVKFEYLNPGVCYLRLYIDENGDEEWTTGDYKTHRQPEAMYYFPKKIELRAYWDVEEAWNYLATPLLQQKPTDIRKPIDAKAQKK